MMGPMKTKFLLVMAAFALINHSAVAGAPGIKGSPINTHPQCVVNANDPFEPRVRMTKGPDAGACINSTLRRSAMQLAPEIAARYFKPVAGTIVVANVSHKKKFWIAQIPINEISNMVLQSEHFPMISSPVEVVIDHTQIRFDFKKPIYLIPQDLKEKREIVTLKNIILSVENIGPRGEKFNFFSGLKGHFNLAYRLVSVEEKFNWMVLENENIVSQRRFKLSQKNQRSVLLGGIRRGTAYGSSRAYHSITRNCSSELLDLFNELFGTKKFKVTGFYSNVLDSHLEKIGMLSDEEMPDFNQEYYQLN